MEMQTLLQPPTRKNMKPTKYTVLMAEAETYDSEHQSFPGPNLYVSRFLFDTKEEARKFVTDKIGQISSSKDNEINWIDWHSLYCDMRYSTNDMDGNKIDRTLKFQIYDGILENSNPVPLSKAKTRS